MADTIHGTSGNDYLENTVGAGAIIYGYEGNDTVYNNRNNDVTISGGDGADSIKVQYSANVAIDGGEDNDKVTVYSGNNASVVGDAGNDTLGVYGTGAFISGGDGADNIENDGNNALIYGGNGDDYIDNDGANSTVYGDAGHDDIYSEGSQNSIYGGSDNDSINVRSNSNGFIDGGTGNDTLRAWYGDNISLTGGLGNDSIDLYSVSCLIAYNTGDGDDTVSGFSDNDALNISGSYSTQESGNDVLVNVGTGSILLQGAKGKTLNITGDTATTTGGGDTPTTGGGEGNDTPSTGGDISGQVIYNENSNTLISGTSYNDSIYSWGDYATINTYAGSDTVHNLGDTIQIDTGTGDDSIYSYSYYGTINAGTGDDIVSLDSSAHDNIIQYANGDGDDVIYNLGTNNTLSISGGSYSSQVSGNNILVNVGSGTITLSGSNAANIIDSTGTTTPTSSTNNHVYTGGNAVISAYAGEQIIVGMLPKEWMFYGSDFYYGSNTGTLVVQNVQNKIIDFRDGNGNSFVKAYTATTAGVINGRGLSGFEYIVGSNTGADAIYAGDGGASLWGGNGNYSDTLIGGAETDVFVSGKSQGNDVITNASIADVVWLRDVNFSDIRYTAENNGVIGIAFNTGNSVLVGSTSNISAIFQFADGTNRRFNHATKSWQGA